jgi:hypothetical protein
MSCSVTENYGALLQRAHRQNYLIGVPNTKYVCIMAHYAKDDKA